LKLAAGVHLCFPDKSEVLAVQKKVLIVDDSPAEVLLMHGVLEREGYRLVDLHDSTRVEETVAFEQPNVILLDVVMPGKNGFQVCRELKGHDLYKTIPVILVTSRDTASDKFWGEQQGADGYVTKPFTSEELLRAVRRFA
jgi:twitching motility two-component system response regulator PilH